MVKERFADLKEASDMIVRRIQNTPYGDSLPVVASDLERSLMIIGEMNARLDMLSEITEIQGEVIHQLVASQRGITRKAPARKKATKKKTTKKKTTKKKVTKKKTTKRKVTKKKVAKRKPAAKRKTVKRKAPARRKVTKKKTTKRRR